MATDEPGKRDGTRPVGRPSNYTKERGQRICEIIATTPKGLSALHKRHPRVVPDTVTLFRWIHAHEEFRRGYFAAKAIQADLLIEECIEIIDGVDASEKNASARVSKAREQLHQRRWMAERLAADRWGSRQALELTGGLEGDNPEHASNELDRRIAAYLRAQARAKPAKGDTDETRH